MDHIIDMEVERDFCLFKLFNLMMSGLGHTRPLPFASLGTEEFTLCNEPIPYLVDYSILGSLFNRDCLSALSQAVCTSLLFNDGDTHTKPMTGINWLALSRKRSVGSKGLQPPSP